MDNNDLDPTKVLKVQNLGPVLSFAKGKIGGEPLTPEESGVQAKALVENLHVVPFEEPGTCGDERGIVGTLDGQPLSRPRRSVFAGPLVFGYSMAELTAWFDGGSTTSVRERFEQSSRLLEACGIVGGGHTATDAVASNLKNGTSCGANDGLENWMDFLIAHPAAVKEVSQLVLGATYDEGAMDELLSRALQGRANVRGWDPHFLIDYLAERAAKAIDVRRATNQGVSGHKGRSVGLITDARWALDFGGLETQTGEQSFLHNLGYGKQIEDALASKSTSGDMELLLKHAQPAVLTGVSGILLNGNQDVFLITPRQ